REQHIRRVSRWPGIQLLVRKRPGERAPRGHPHAGKPVGPDASATLRPSRRKVAGGARGSAGAFEHAGAPADDHLNRAQSGSCIDGPVAPVTTTSPSKSLTGTFRVESVTVNVAV